ncbi:hypothetical protein BUALT_Bualt15G0057700 [Buddleja alternifolia]|uniref:V-SNARE coiled-coil homology domain-containing protein n=1 Tax=Buddleja alternifolia TaxID=168488 RepID=A0AAV6WI78_9LAMI|nr:hypothetical protein BUALT_Bualt15G0057700 [Buddleja alternifolia]
MATTYTAVVTLMHDLEHLVRSYHHTFGSGTFSFGWGKAVQCLPDLTLEEEIAMRDDYIPTEIVERRAIIEGSKSILSEITEEMSSINKELKKIRDDDDRMVHDLDDTIAASNSTTGNLSFYIQHNSLA